MELGRRGPPVRRAPPARRRSSSASCGATSSRRRPRNRRSLRCRASTSSSGLQHPRRSSRRSSQHPDFLDGPELVTPPVVYNAGLLRAIGRPIDTTAWSWLCSGAGQQLFYPPNVSGWDFTRWLDTSTAKARWEIASYVTAKTYPNPWPGAGEAELQRDRGTGGEALASALAYWGNPALSSESQRCIAAFAQSCLQGVATAKWQQSPYRAMRQNALRMLIATVSGHAGELRWPRAARATTSPARSCCAPGVAQAGRGLPSIEPGQPLPAGSGHGQARVPAALGRGRCCRSTAPRRSRRAHFEEGIAQAAAAAPPNQPVLVSIFMEGGWDALSVLAPVREAKYHELRPTLARNRRRRRGVHRGRSADVASAGRRSGPAARRRQGHACSRRSATTRPTRATSPAATTGRSAN